MSRGSIIETFYLGTFLLFEIAGSLAVYFRFARAALGEEVPSGLRRWVLGGVIRIVDLSCVGYPLALGLPRADADPKSADDSSGLEPRSPVTK